MQEQSDPGTLVKQPGRVTTRINPCGSPNSTCLERKKLHSSGSKLPYCRLAAGNAFSSFSCHFHPVIVWPQRAYDFVPDLKRLALNLPIMDS